MPAQGEGAVLESKRKLKAGCCCLRRCNEHVSGKDSALHTRESWQSTTAAGGRGSRCRVRNNDVALTRLAERKAWSLELGAWLRCHVDPIPRSGRAGTTGLAITPKGCGHRFLDDPNTVAISMRRISKTVIESIQHRTAERRTQRRIVAICLKWA